MTEKIIPYVCEKCKMKVTTHLQYNSKRKICNICWQEEELKKYHEKHGLKPLRK